jgi:hypothetical protein
MSSTYTISGRKLQTRAVCARYDIVDRTLARWMRNPDLGFPVATNINGRLYFDEVALDEWDAAMAAKSRRTA